TMGYPLKHIGIANLFRAILQLYKNKIKLNQKDLYYKDVINILSNKSIQTIYKKHNIEINKVVSEKIVEPNKVFITTNELRNLINNPEIKNLHQLIFINKTDFDTILKNSIKIIELLKTNSENILSIEYLNRIHEIFNQIITFNSQYKFIRDCNTLLSFYNEMVATQNLFFKGEPLDGLQIMGMLETRNLDFENIIVTSVNEGFLPSGKTASSFIPFDVKIELGLPTYKEKDAIFSYHFFRLLQRAKNIFLLYNTETDEFGASEKSRFLLQLEQLSKPITNHKITHKIVSPISLLKLQEPLHIEKNDEIIKTIDSYNKDKGFSPSALTNYIANPIYFYQQRILGIKDTDTIEETIALNTLGNIIHEVLEDFYKPLKQRVLIVEDLVLLKKKIPSKTNYYFEKNFNNENYKQGKNLLIFEIAKQYIANFLDNEINSVKQGNEIIILALEKELRTKITIGDKTVNLRGFADRIEKFNGITRIIDYKTGKVIQSDINKISWEESRDKYKKYAKRFQLYFYAYCYIKENKINVETTPIESGIISFKNLKEKFLKVDKTIITKESLHDFESELKWLLQEIYNPDIPFIENTNPPY
ncbi:MAG TPA: PD-(D/E)XK nuclease family protein, partial [Flavobacteriia bacterium]|nr:PD-(D/E)XK nuclease family protein [Flavobacteriia bacterium]